jgi:hypothetical protein
MELLKLSLVIFKWNKALSFRLHGLIYLYSLLWSFVGKLLSLHFSFLFAN